MTARTKDKAAEATDATAEDTTAKQETKDETPPPCAAVHTLPLLAHVTCQRPAFHPDDQPEGPDQDKHRARVAGALYVW